MAEVSPAIEISPEEAIIAFNIKYNEDEEDPEIKNQYLTLKNLGYKSYADSEGIFLTLPDRKALLVQWDQLKQEKPDIPDLDIVSSEAIADDLDFVEAFFTHDALLSSGKEFIHDHTAHVIPTLVLMINSNKNENPDYKKDRFKLVKKVAENYRKLMIAKTHLDQKQKLNNDERLLKKELIKLEAALGAMVDSISSYSQYKNPQLLDAFKSDFFKTIWNNPTFGFAKRFDFKFSDTTKLAKLWEQIKEIEKNFDNRHLA